jgi:phenylpropionate dioxygenase-like ring-hydroxylating dioxygenase large terminal subunit
MLKNFWYACEFSSAVTNKPKQIVMLKQRFVLYRNSQGQVVALKDQCPHRGAALSLGWVEDDSIRCPYHGWKFQADGRCIDIPANAPEVPIPKKACVETYPMQEKYGFVWLFYGDLPEEERPPIPPLPEFEDPNLHHLFYEFRVNAHYTRTLENALDFAHISIVHANSFGKGFDREQKIEKYEVNVEDWGVNAIVNFKQYTRPKGFLKFFHRPGTTEVKSKISFYLPNINKMEGYFVGGKLVNFGIHVPIDDNTTLVKRIQFRSFFTYPWADLLFQRSNVKINQEDRVVAESEYPKAIPNDLSDEVHVSCDGVSLAYRKLRQKYLAMGWGLKPYESESDNSNGHPALPASASLVN